MMQRYELRDADDNQIAILRFDRVDVFRSSISARLFYEFHRNGEYVGCTSVGSATTLWSRPDDDAFRPLLITGGRA